MPIAWSWRTRLFGSVGWIDQLQTASRWAMGDAIVSWRTSVSAGRFSQEVGGERCTGSKRIDFLDGRGHLARVAARAIGANDKCDHRLVPCLHSRRATQAILQPQSPDHDERFAHNFTRHLRSALKTVGEDNRHFDNRSEERRVGKECRSRWSPY